MEEEAVNGAEIKTSFGSVKWSGKRIAEFITVLSLFATIFLGYVWWEHKNETAAAQKELSSNLRDMVMSQRELTCISSLPEAERKAEFQSPYGFCKRMAR
jgi:hypothetical protein